MADDLTEWAAQARTTKRRSELRDQHPEIVALIRRFTDMVDAGQTERSFAELYRDKIRPVAKVSMSWVTKEASIWRAERGDT